MQKNRSRSVKNSFEFSTNFLESLPNIERVQVNKSRNGDLSFLPNNKFNYGKCQSTFSYDRSTLTNESDLDIISFGKSSSSSISWSDDFDVEATKRVQLEFERMERILQGQEPIPSHYNKDEYKQWIKTFPQLSITGRSIQRPSVLHKKIDETNSNLEEVFASDVDPDYLTLGEETMSSLNLEKIKEIKDEAVETVFYKISKKWFKKNYDIKSQVLQFQPNVETKTSPLFPKKLQHKTIKKQQQQSSKSEDVLKWMCEPSNKYSSLPHIKSANKVKVRKKSSGVSRYSKNTSPNKTNCVSLPPIDIANIPSGRFRSFSTTPRFQQRLGMPSSIPVRSKTQKVKCNLEFDKRDV
ncbi:hypothetical protein FQA39_LY13216 [Lamprigera yunnana]|nr:hypothetical protein FQA39_LY13216 [Lamprigera yunnana]